jgi:trimeric autotransporter adhesin
VGLTGASGSALIVDTSVASQGSGLRITGAVTGGTVNLSANDTGPNTNITFNANGSGTIGIGNVSTGVVTITPPTTLTAAATLSSTLTYGGVTLSNSVTGTGSMVLSAAPTISGAATLSGVPVLSGLSAGTCSSGLAINASNQAIKVACPGAAASIQIAVTTVTSGTNGNLLYNNSGTLGNETIASILTAGTGITISGTTNATIGLSTITGPGVLGSISNGAGQTVGTVKTEVFLETLNPAGVATSPTTVSWAGFNHIKFIVSNCIPATTNQALWLQIVTGGGTQSTNYAGQLSFSNAGTAGGFTTTTSAFALSGNVSNTAAQGLGATAYLRNITSTTLGHQVSGTFIQNTAIGGSFGSIWTGTAALTGGVFLFASGNISSCRIDVWGIP